MRFEACCYEDLRASLRTVCDDLLGKGVAENTVFDSRLVIFELVSNIFQHGGGKAFVTVEADSRAIGISVRGERAFRPPEKSECSPVDAERGRGLFLVDAVASGRSYSEEKGVCVTLPLEK